MPHMQAKVRQRFWRALGALSAALTVGLIAWVAFAPPSKDDQGFRATIVGFVLAALGALASAVSWIRYRDSRDEKTPVEMPSNTAVTQPVKPGPLVPGDDTKFIADVTVPDGSTLRPGEKFTKVWLVRNNGTVPWLGRSLRRQGAASGPGLIQAPNAVPIRRTMPGQQVRVEIDMVAPSVPTSTTCIYKMTDKSGRLYFPGKYGLSVTINVSEQ